MVFALVVLEFNVHEHMNLFCTSVHRTVRPHFNLGSNTFEYVHYDPFTVFIMNSSQTFIMLHTFTVTFVQHFWFGLFIHHRGFSVGSDDADTCTRILT